MATDPNRHNLPKDVSGLRALVAQLAEQHQQDLATRDQRIYALERENRLLRRELFGPKSERRPTAGFELEHGQMALLFPELMEAADRVADEKLVQGSVEMHRPGGSNRPKRRKEFPPHLPVMRSTFELPMEQRGCSCGAMMHQIGEVTSRELERLEIAVVHEIVRAKYACKSCESTVRVAPGPDRVIDKGLLGAGFLAQILVERFAHHMPYHRLERKYASEGFDLSRSVLCESSAKCAEILEPIAKQILADALATGVVQTDDTRVTIQQGSQNNSRRGHVWVYRGLGGQVYFDATENRSRDGPTAVLAGFSGFLQADGYAVYSAFFRDRNIREVGCWAHARRYFVQAEETEPELARVALAMIGQLFAVERRIREAGCSLEEVVTIRREKSLPLLEWLRDWMTITQPTVHPESALNGAIEYALKRWAALTRYCEDGRLNIDNNGAERSLRAVAVGRKNWIFFGNERGGNTAAVMYSLIATCREHDIDPRMYLRDVLLRISKTSDVRELTPYGWKARWMPIVQAHRASILERLAVKVP